LVYLWRESPSLAKKRILTPKKEPCIIQGLKDMEILKFSTVCTTQMLQCKYSLKTTIIWNITICSHRPHLILLNVDYVLPLLWTSLCCREAASCSKTVVQYNMLMGSSTSSMTRSPVIKGETIVCIVLNTSG
jgi:hypothetical protein